MVDFDALVLGPAMGVFGGTAMFTPGGGAPMPVTGVFDAVHRLVEVDMGQNASGTLAVSSTAPAFGIRLKDFPAAPEQGDGLRWGGVDYQIVDIRPDGQGGAQLILQRA
ncbi:MAG: hypothetical protein HQL41_09020 [Alphaproteobacteria bacterium]|nr:hypothetical protein [Alphaproteobacteria bacterium]